MVKKKTKRYKKISKNFTCIVFPFLIRFIPLYMRLQGEDKIEKRYVEKYVMNSNEI